jgi:AAA domain
VRNNPRAGVGALGFLRDRRRINVALSRAKSQLVVVGSLNFLQKAVLGVNPDQEDGHDLSFLTQIVQTIKQLTAETRGNDKLPLAALIEPSALRAAR